MPLKERQKELVEELSVIPDATERFAWLVEGAKGSAPIPEEERVDAFRVHGCQSNLWIVPTRSSSGLWRFRVWSEAPMVHALAALHARLYKDQPGPEIAEFEPTFLDDLQLMRHLTPNRRHGMRLIIEKIRGYVSDSPR